MTQSYSLPKHKKKTDARNKKYCSFATDGLQMASPQAADRLRRAVDGIIDGWTRALREQMTAAQKDTESTDLRGWLPELLQNLADALETSHWRFGEKRNVGFAREHGLQRQNSGIYTIDAVINEYAVLRGIICEALQREGPLPPAITARVHAFLDAAICSASTAFVTDTPQQRGRRSQDECGLREAELATRDASPTEWMQQNRSFRALEACLQDVADLAADKQVSDRRLSRLGHDLRSPLSALSMRAQCLEMRPDDSGMVSRTIPRLLSAIERMDAIIQDTLDARDLCASRGLPVRLAACDLAHLARQAHSSFATRYGSRIKLQVPSLGCGTWDPKALRRVVDNLVENALKFGDKNKDVTIFVTDVGSKMRLAVQNFGCPLTQQDIQALLGHPPGSVAASNGEHKQRGVGLTLVLGITEMHGGEVGASSDAAHGTIFWCEYPKAPELQYAQRGINARRKLSTARH